MSYVRMVGRTPGSRGLMRIAVATAMCLGILGIGATAAQAGPLLLMGIDAEDGGPGGHGPISVYQNVVNNGVLANVTNGGSGILVVGGGKNPGDNVTAFWNAVDAATAGSVTYVNGAGNISAQSFAGFAMIAVASSQPQTPDGGLTQAENTALAGRQSDIATFVNAGGGLMGLSQISLTPQYGYLPGADQFTFANPPQYSNINATIDGNAVGINDMLDICCWHDEYTTYPAFLAVLATNAATGNAAALGGAAIIIPDNEPPVAVDDQYNATQGKTLTVAAAGVLANDTDADGDPLTAVLVSAPTKGTLALNANGSFTYLSEDFGGVTDTFTYKANDGTDDSNVATVTIKIAASCDGFKPTKTGTQDDDTIAGTPARDVIVGNGGNDTITGSSHDDIICGGSGADTLDGDSAHDRVFGGSGNDLVEGSSGKDRLFGEAGNDKLRGDSGNDRLDGGTGADHLTDTGGSSDRCDGGPNVDTGGTGCETTISIP